MPTETNIRPLTSVSINSVGEVIKSVLGDSFVYRTSTPENKMVKLDTAIRQDEEFKAMFTRVLWDEFIPYGASTASSKLSTLFTRNLTYVSKHGLVGAKKSFLAIISHELFDCEVRHIKDELIHFAARNRAHGALVFNEAQMNNDENRKIDYIGAKNELREELSRAFYKSFVPGMQSQASPYNRIYRAFSEVGYFTECKEVHDIYLDKFIAVLLMLSLNLYDICDEEHAEILDCIEDYVRCSAIAVEKSECISEGKLRERGLNRGELQQLMWWAVTELEHKLGCGERVTLDTVSDMIKNADISKVFEL